MGKSFGGIAFTVVLIGLVVWSRMGRMSDAKDEVLKEMQSVVATLDVYAKNQDFLDPIVERAHAAAFNDAYAIGGRYRRDKFDWDKYLTAFFDDACKQCDQRKKPDVAKSLRALQQTMILALKSADQKEKPDGGK